MNAQTYGEWISTSDRLPELYEGFSDCMSFKQGEDGVYYGVDCFTEWESDPVLAVGEFENRRVIAVVKYIEWRYDDGSVETAWRSFDEEDIGNVRFWTPIPALPEMQEV